MIKPLIFLIHNVFNTFSARKDWRFEKFLLVWISFVFPEMMRNLIFDFENGGSTYTWVNTVMKKWINKKVFCNIVFNKVHQVLDDEFCYIIVTSKKLFVFLTLIVKIMHAAYLSTSPYSILSYHRRIFNNKMQRPVTIQLYKYKTML